jgi:hypothetical protein
MHSSALNEIQAPIKINTNSLATCFVFFGKHVNSTFSVGIHLHFIILFICNQFFSLVSFYVRFDIFWLFYFYKKINLHRGDN